MWCIYSAQGLKNLIRKHESPVEDDRTTLRKVCMQNAGAEAITYRQDEHGSFIVGQILTANNRTGIRQQIAMSYHHKSGNARRT